MKNVTLSGVKLVTNTGWKLKDVMKRQKGKGEVNTIKITARERQISFVRLKFSLILTVRESKRQSCGFGANSNVERSTFQSPKDKIVDIYSLCLQ